MRLSILIRSALGLLLLLLPLAAIAADEFTVYHPKYRATEEMVSLGESAFGGKATFSSLGGKVVINASPKTTASVLKLFAEVDKIPRQFKISFRLVAREESEGNSISFKNGQITLGKNPRVGGTLSVEGGQAANQKEAIQSAQLMEGTEAQMVLRNDWFPGGFIAKARAGAGDLVTVEFRQREADANPAFSIQSEAVLKLGEWKAVGEVIQTSSGSGKGIVSQSEQLGSVKKNLQVKLELAK